MKLASPPDQCLAIVVGIEHYDAIVDDWTLHGPALDALTFAQWLRERGVPAAGIRLFVNFARDAAGNEAPGPEAAEIWKALAEDGVVREAPNRDALAVLLDRPQRRADAPGALDLPAPSMLVIYWSGHGVVDDRKTDRYFYTGDATDTYQRAIDLSSTLERFELDSTLGRTFRQQLVIADACGQWAAERGYAPKFDSVSKVGEKVSHLAEQCALWATAEGEFARTSQDGGMSVFTRALMPAVRELSTGAKGTANAWPEIDEVFEKVRTVIGQGSQHPTLYRKRSRQPEEAERFGRESPAAIRLAKILSTSSLDLMDLRPHFRRVAPTHLAMPLAADASVRALANLVGADDATRFTPLARYAAGVLFACESRIVKAEDSKERATLEETRDALSAWAVDHADGPGWKHALKELRAPRPIVSHLVIDIPPNGSAIRAWLIPTNPLFDVKLGPDDAPLAQAIYDLIESALPLCKDLIIELRVGFDALLDGLDRLEIERPVVGKVTDPWVLGRDFVTYLRWRDRRDEPLLAEEWLKAWRQIRTELMQVGAVGKLRWLDDPRRPPNFRRVPCDTWLGVPGKLSEGPSNRALQSALMRGAPLLVWPSVRARDVKACKLLADTLIASTSIDDFAERWGKAHDDDPDIEDLHVLIDDPTRIPEIDQFQQPEQRERP